ncbi:MAG: hypothetical protein ABNH21_16480 [Glaciecola sp.]|jgi:hypothetical protein
MLDISYFQAQDLREMEPELREESLEELSTLYPQKKPINAIEDMIARSDATYTFRWNQKIAVILGVKKHSHISNIWCKTAKWLDNEPRVFVKVTRSFSANLYKTHGAFYSVVSNKKSSRLFCKASGMRYVETRDDGRLVFVRDNRLSEKQNGH